MDSKYDISVGLACRMLERPRVFLHECLDCQLQSLIRIATTLYRLPCNGFNRTISPEMILQSRFLIREARLSGDWILHGFQCNFTEQMIRNLLYLYRIERLFHLYHFFLLFFAYYPLGVRLFYQVNDLLIVAQFGLLLFQVFQFAKPEQFYGYGVYELALFESVAQP